MKKITTFTFALSSLLAVSVLASCGKKPDPNPKEEFAFTVGIEGDYESLEVRETPYQLVTYDNGIDVSGRVYEFTTSDSNVASINSVSGSIVAKKAGDVTFTVKETKSGKEQTYDTSVVKASPKANGGKNFAAASTVQDIAKRTEILGKLEKYAMDSHLTGISLFENGGLIKYSSRVRGLLPTQGRYISGYGFGLLSDSPSPITTKLSGPGADNEFPYYYHSAASSDPGNINALNAAGSQVMDLASYITGSYFSMKLNNDKTSAVWYPMFADPDAHAIPSGQKYPKMYHLGEDNEKGLYTGWRIYLRTGSALKYRMSEYAPDEVKGFNNREVKVEDYETIMRFLLTGSHNLKRGNELAGDTSYGIKGAMNYNASTKSDTLTDEEAKNIWQSMQKSGKLGLRTGHDDEKNSDYIEFELVNPIDSFTAMYTLSSSLYSPVPEDFLKTIGSNGKGDADGRAIVRAATRFGQFNNNDNVPSWMKNNILASTINVGAYYLEKWEKKSRTIFTTNKDYYEYDEGRYQIDGIRIKIIEGASEEPDKIYDEFNSGNLDACGLPQKHIDEKGTPGVYETEGDSVFKLNVNSCTQEQWDYNFGPEGKIADHRSWDVKPYMSNDNFLKGLYWSIDRKSFAEKRGVQPSINYFSSNYLSNPQENESYNSTEAHKQAVAAYHNVEHDSTGKEIPGTDDYGYNKDDAISYFKMAVNQLIKSGDMTKGTVENPKVYPLEIWWMYQSDITDYGVDIKNDFESAFNDPKVSGGKIKLNVINNAVTDWEQVYDSHLMTGEFDLGFGAISGNTYSPLNFMEVLKSDNSSTFTLNWGADTSVVDEKHPIVYEGEKYSFDALWEVADHGGIVKEGEKVKPVEKCYKGVPVGLDGKAIGGDYINGAKVDVKTEFVNVGSSVSFNVDSVSIYIVGGPSYSSLDSDSGITFDPATQKVTISAELAKEVDTQIKKAQKITEDNPTEFGNSQFTNNKYNQYWCFDVYYTLTIEGSQPQQNVISAASSKDRV